MLPGATSDLWLSTWCKPNVIHQTWILWCTRHQAVCATGTVSGPGGCPLLPTRITEPRSLWPFCWFTGCSSLSHFWYWRWRPQQTHRGALTHSSGHYKNHSDPHFPIFLAPTSTLRTYCSHAANLWPYTMSMGINNTWLIPVFLMWVVAFTMCAFTSHKPTTYQTYLNIPSHPLIPFLTYLVRSLLLRHVDVIMHTFTLTFPRASWSSCCSSCILLSPQHVGQAVC